jgi:amino acid transporter
VLNDVTYVPTRWQGTLLIIASAVGIGLFNVFAAKHLPLAEGVFVTFHVFAFFPIVIVLLLLSPKQSAHDVFANFTDNGAGWPNVGWATLVGQVSSMFVVLGSDSVAHMAEEIEDAGVIVPRSMVWTFLLNVPLTFGLLLTYLFCIGDVSKAIASPTGFPFIYVFQNATGTVGGTTGMTIVVLLLIIMITISTMASTSRQTFAFARDNGLPFSNWLGHVSRHHPSRSAHFAHHPELTGSVRSIVLGTYPSTAFSSPAPSPSSCP